MPKLLKQAEDNWAQAEPSVIEWKNLEQWQAGDPLLLAGDAEPSEAHTQASAIAIEFPAFNDGRGLSVAVLLRTRLNYQGPLYAVGAIHEDILHYITRCGFDHIELPDDRDVDVAIGVLSPYSAHYQGSTLDPRPAFRRENRGANA